MTSGWKDVPAALTCLAAAAGHGCLQSMLARCPRIRERCRTDAATTGSVQQVGAALMRQQPGELACARGNSSGSPRLALMELPSPCASAGEGCKGGRQAGCLSLCTGGTHCAAHPYAPFSLLLKADAAQTHLMPSDHTHCWSCGRCCWSAPPAPPAGRRLRCPRTPQCPCCWRRTRSRHCAAAATSAAALGLGQSWLGCGPQWRQPAEQRHLALAAGQT